MHVYVNVDFGKAFDALAEWTGSTRTAGRQLALAMANGYYGCRKYIVMFSEDTGNFSLICA